MKAITLTGNRVIVNMDSTEAGLPSGFVNSITGQNADPTVVLLKVSVNGGTPVTYTYGSGDGVIIRTAVGFYYASLDATNLAGEWTAQWIGDPDGTSPMVCQALNAIDFTVDSAPL